MNWSSLGSREVPKQRAFHPGSRGPRRWRCAQTNRSGRPRQRPPGHSGAYYRGYPRGRSEICGKPGGCCRSCGVDGDELTRVLEFRIQFPPADSPSLSGFRVRSRAKPGFSAIMRPFREAVVSRDAQSPAASGRAALVSLSNHISVPQCCRRRFARLAAPAAN